MFKYTITIYKDNKEFGTGITSSYNIFFAFLGYISKNDLIKELSNGNVLVLVYNEEISCSFSIKNGNFMSIDIL